MTSEVGKEKALVDIRPVPSAVQISAILVDSDPSEPAKHLCLRLIVNGQRHATLPFDPKADASSTPFQWKLEPYFSLQLGSTLVIQLRRRHHWPKSSTLLEEAAISFEDAQKFGSVGEKAFRLRDNPRIMAELASGPGALHTTLNASIEKAREKKSVLDHLGKSKRFLETLLGFGVGLSELDPIAKAVLACVQVVYDNLEEHDQCDKLILDLAESMARTLGYIEDVEQFARIYQLKRSIEEIRPLMEDTANFILTFTTRSASAGFTRSWRDRDKVDELAKRYKNFKDQFDRGIAVQSGANLAVLLEAMTSAKDDDMLLHLKPKGLETGAHMGECLRGTREDIMASVEQWINDLKAKNILWIRGFPGVGKSAIASTLVGRIQVSHRLGSSFVFERAKATVTTTTALWRNVAFDLARAYPTVRKVVVAKLEEGVVQPTTSNVKMLFRNLIEEPLKASNDIPFGRLPVVVIDALDECGGLDGRQSVQRIGLLQSLKLWSKLPSRFKLVVTSRREDDILRVLTPLCEAIDIPSGSTVNHQASEDIRLFLVSRFAKIAKNYPESLEPSWPGETVIAELTSRAAGLFIWAKTAADFVNAGEPKAQLRQILKGGTGLGDLAALYTHILHTSFKGPSTEVLHSFKDVVGATTLAKAPLHRTECIDLLGIQPSMLDFIRNGLRSVMDAGDVLRFSHHSFVDFLIDPQKCPRPFLIDEGDQHRVLAIASFRTLKAGLRFNICGLETSSLRNHDVPDLDVRIDDAISPHLSYACRFWADHLRATSFEPAILEELRHLLNEHFLHWLEVLSLLKELNVVVPALAAVIRWCPEYEIALPTFARDAFKFMAAFGPVIAQSVPHLYISALPFAPRNSVIFQHYSSRFPQTLSLQTGRINDWPAIQYVAEGHTHSVNSVRFSHHGKYFASAAADKTIRIWDTETGSLVSGPLRGHRGAVNSVAFSPDDALVVSASDDRTVRVWDVESGDLISGEFEGHAGSVTSVAFSGDGRIVVSGSEDKTIRLWDVYTADPILLPFEGHQRGVTAVAFAKDQKYIVSSSSDRTIIVWDATTGHIIAGPWVGHSAWINCVAISPDGTRFASGADDRIILVRDVKTGALVSQPFEGHRDGVTSVAFSRDGTRIVSGSHDETVRIWDTQTGKTISGPFRGHSDGVTSVDFSMDGRRIASASHDRTIRIWDTAATGTTDSGKPGHFEAHSDGVNSVAFSRNGRYIVSGSDDLTVRIWDAVTGKPKSKPLAGHTSWIDSVDVSPDSKRIASGSDDSNVFIWDIKSGALERQFGGHTGGITSVTFHPDNIRVASSSYDKTIRIWDLVTGHLALPPIVGHTGWVTSVAFSPDGKLLASGSYGKTIRIWDAQTGAAVAGPFKGHRDGVNCIAFSPNGLYIASGSSDETIQVWDLSTGRPARAPFLGHTNRVVSLAYSADGTYIVSGSDDRTIRIWNAENGSLVQGPFEGHSGGIDSVAFSPDGDRFVSGSEDETIRVWSIDKHRETGSFGITQQHLADDWKLQNGWVLSSDMSLLFWVPPWNRAGLWWPRNVAVIAEVSTKLSFEHFVFGPVWYQCCEPIPSSAV
ncbi:hypothetical protein Hypma_003814 [Hypsizygus marmoreus]|uniref:Nephrocystin 3-like N-terminal domain-containing protein n=1 Tax=Hypsizygus marmoreus TaxID=39966 RepID=A0A369K0M7_HYPMA|nr:hypothetical protein Hypma_003814 [Hypsizygus marmoreus]